MNDTAESAREVTPSGLRKPILGRAGVADLTGRVAPLTYMLIVVEAVLLQLAASR